MKIKYALSILITLASAGAAAAAETRTCNDPGVAGLYMQASLTGKESARQNLGSALFTLIRCLSTSGVALPKSQLRGPYSIAVEYLAYTSKVSIALVSDEEIDAMARLLPKAKAEKNKKDTSGGSYD